VRGMNRPATSAAGDRPDSRERRGQRATGMSPLVRSRVSLPLHTRERVPTTMYVRYPPPRIRQRIIHPWIHFEIPDSFADGAWRFLTRCGAASFETREKRAHPSRRDYLPGGSEGEEATEVNKPAEARLLLWRARSRPLCAASNALFKMSPPPGRQAIPWERAPCAQQRDAQISRAPDAPAPLLLVSFFSPLR